MHYIRAPFYQKRHFPHYFTLKIGTLRVTWGRHVPPVPPPPVPTYAYEDLPHVRTMSRLPTCTQVYLFFEVAVLTRESTVREQDFRPN